jgi:hypothetical protein
LPPATHIGDPVEHATVAIWHDPPSAHDDPTAQATHAPLLHTAPASHVVPLNTVPSGMHVAAPPSQTVSPCTHGPSEQLDPSTHAPPSPAPLSSTPSASVPASGSVITVVSPPESLDVTPPLELPWPSVDASGPPPVVKSPSNVEQPALVAPATNKRPHSL